MPEQDKQESVLQEADRVINGEKRDDYGNVHASFEQVARMWRAVLDSPGITSYDVAICMICLKLCRGLYSMQRDTLVDIAGYTGLLAQLQGIDKS